jgi:hypothetical protein
MDAKACGVAHAHSHASFPANLTGTADASVFVDRTCVLHSMDSRSWTDCWFELRSTHVSLLHYPHSLQRDIRSSGCRSRRVRDGFGFLNEAFCRCIKRLGVGSVWPSGERPSGRAAEPLRLPHNSTLARVASNPSSEWEAVVFEVPGLRYRSPKKECIAHSRRQRCAMYCMLTPYSR